jgi:hypothetical protein
VQKKHKIPEEIIIEPKCIHSRAKKRDNFTGGISGNTSPMSDIEPYLVKMIGQLKKIYLYQTGKGCHWKILLFVAHHINQMLWPGKKSIALEKKQCH